jgi:hypothetical protein
MSNKKKTAIIKFSSHVVVQAEMTKGEYSVLKLALKYYANSQGVNLLKRLERAES